MLADILGISQSQYSKLENGETAFDIRTLSKLIDELDLNLEGFSKDGPRQERKIGIDHRHCKPSLLLMCNVASDSFLFVKNQDIFSMATQMGMVTAASTVVTAMMSQA